MGQVRSRKKHTDEESLMGMARASKSECNSAVMIYIHRCGKEYKENASEDKNEGKWNDLLEDLATKLLPDIEYYQRGIIMAGRVFSIIKYFRDDVNRVKIGGSVGKHTGISTRCIQSQKGVINSEFDLYVFLINQKPPFGKVIEEFRDHLENLKNFLPEFCWLPENETCIDFKIERKVYHLYPAVNFIEISDKDTFSNMDSLIQTFITESKHFVGVQRLGVLREIQTLDNIQDKSFYFSSLEESCVRFFKSRPRYIRQVIRLVRYWNHCVNYHQDPINGCSKRRSVMLDLCVLKASLMCSSVSVNLHDILRKVMELIIDFQNICILFQMDEDKIVEYDKLKISLNEGKVTILMEFPSPLDSNTVMSKIDYIPLIQKTLIHSIPCVLDPCNPFNNLADFHVDDWEVLKRCANQTLVRLEEKIFQTDEMIHKIFEND